jgi:hypothetical protein
MPFVSLISHHGERGNSSALRIAAEAKHLVIKVRDDLVRSLGWKTGDRFEVLCGTDDDVGQIQVKPHPRGWGLHLPGGGSRVAVIEIPVRLVAGAVPTPSTPVRYAVDGNSLTCSLPWAGTAVPEPAPRAIVSYEGDTVSVDWEAVGIFARESADRGALDFLDPPKPEPAPVAQPVGGRPSDLKAHPINHGHVDEWPPEVRAAFIEGVLAGQSQLELAAICGRPRGSIKYIIHQLAAEIKKAKRAGPAKSEPAPESAPPTPTEKAEPASAIEPPPFKGPRPSVPSTPVDKRRFTDVKLAPVRPSSNVRAASVPQEAVQGTAEQRRISAVDPGPTTISAAVHQEIREKAYPVLLPAGYQIGKSRDGDAILIDGKPMSPAEVFDLANMSLKESGLDPIRLEAGN